MLSDIKQAFLNIKLSDPADRNKFTVLWRDKNNKLIAFRYCSLVFGLASSPFILNKVIKHHIGSYEYDECTKILDKQIYVDNLVFTGSDIDNLFTLYNQSLSRMKEGGFILRSWSSNSSKLQSKFETDETCLSPPLKVVKMLGYNYHAESDKLSIALDYNRGNKPITKRNILAHNASIFDPLGLANPVSVSAIVILQELWK